MKNQNTNEIRSAKSIARACASKALVVFMSFILVMGTSPFMQIAAAEEASLEQTNVQVQNSSEPAAASETSEQAAVDDSPSTDAGTTEQATTTAANSNATEQSATTATAESSSGTTTTTEQAAAASSTADSNASVNLVGSSEDEQTSTEEDAIALADNGQDEGLAEGTYGGYTYKKNSLTDAFLNSEYDGFRDPVATQWLGIAGSFHITAFDTLTTSSHIYGNVLAKTMNGSNNFGQTSEYEKNYGYKPLSYVQEYTNPSSNPAGIDDGIFVIGSGNTVTKVDNGNHLAINDANKNPVQLNSPKTLIQDADTAKNPFIDLNAVKTYTTQVSNNLAKQANVGADVVTEGSNTVINYQGDSGCAYVTLKASQLNSMNELHIKGMQIGEKDSSAICSVVINVEMDTDTLNLSKVHVILPNGQKANAGESNSTVGYVMFNIKNSTSAMTINLSDVVLASVLAPNATINLGGTAAGTFIGNKVNVLAESHARPFRGTLKPVTDELSVKKVWKDAYGNVESDEVANEHAAITVKVYQRSKAKDAADWGDWAEYKTLTLSKDNKWAASLTDLPKQDTDGTTYEYKVDEASKTADYDTAVTNDGSAWTIINQHKAVVNLSVEKKWVDSNDADGKRPGEITVKVTRSLDGRPKDETFEKTLTLSANKDDASKDWKASLTNLPAADADGNEYTYYVDEVKVDGYEVSIESGREPDKYGNMSYSFTLTNTHEAQKVAVKVKKVWKDNDNKAKVRPTSVAVQLYTVDNEGNLTAVDGKSATLDESNKWAAEWNDLLANEGGNTVSYTVRELDPETNEPVEDGTKLNNGYTVTYDESDGAETSTYTYTVTNTYEDDEDEMAFSLSGYSMQADSGEISEPDKVCYVDPKIYKVLEGRTLKDGEFSFQLIDDATGRPASTAENDAAGMVDFDAGHNLAPEGMEPSCLSFTSPGTYSYTVYETPGKAKDLSVVYSTEVVKFVTTIGKKDDGSLYEVESHYVKYANATDAAANAQGTIYKSTEHPTITNKVKPIYLALTKTDADTGTALAGATYGLYRVDDTASTGAVLVAKATSDSDGLMVFAAGDSEAITAGASYYFKEISAPAGYAVTDASTTAFTIVANADGTYSLTYEDGTVSNAAHAGTAADPIVFKPGEGVTDKKIAIAFGKVASDGTALSGAGLAILDEAGNKVDAWTTDGTGHVVTGLVVGAKYTFTEQTAPEGYTKAADVVFTVDEYGNVSVVSDATTNDLMNAYATGSTLNLVDYKQTELENKQTVVREKGINEKKGTNPTKSSMPATGDNSRFLVIPAIVGTLFVAAGLSARRRREEQRSPSS